MDPPIWTGTWRDNRFSPPADGGKPENAMSGTLPMVAASTVDFPLLVPAGDGHMRFWRNTAVASQSPGTVMILSAGCNCLLGYEWDSDVDNGFRPAGIVHLSTTTETTTKMILDPYGEILGPGVATHNMTLYRDASTALVFSAGTVNYAKALDGNSFLQASIPDPNVQQA